MTRVVFQPTPVGVEVRALDGSSVDAFPVASAKSAGVMTASQATMLEEVFAWFRSASTSAAPVVIERSADMAQYPTRAEVAQLVQTAVPRMLPDLAGLRGQVMALRAEVQTQQTPVLLPPPAADLELARTVEDLSARLQAVETVIEALRVMVEDTPAEAP